MIIVNGVIQRKVQTGGGIDTNGNPARPSFVWDNPVECHIKVNKRDNLGKQNGNTFTVASYEIIIEPQAFDADVIKITDKSGTDLGEFSVISIEHLEAVETVKILV